MAALSSAKLKKNFHCRSSLELFYTGGPAKITPDASLLVCACSDQVKVVELASGSVRASLEGDSEPITALAITPDGASLFAASRSRQLKMWDLASTTCKRSWKAHEGPVADMAVDASGALLATASADRSVLVWDVDHGFCTHAFRGHKGVVSVVLFHPDPHRLLLFSGGEDATVRIWDLVAKKCVALLEKHFSAVTSLAMSKNGWNLLSAGRDKVVNIWDLRDYSLLSTIPVYEALEYICVIPDNSQLANVSNEKSTPPKKQKKAGSAPIRFVTVGEKGIVRMWLSEGGICVYEQKSSDVALASPNDEQEQGGYGGALLMPNAEGLVCITTDQRFIFYEAVGSEGESYDLKVSKRLIGCNEEIIDLKFLGESQTSLAVATNLEQVRIYDLETMACRQELFGHSDIVLCLDTCISSFNMTLLASGGKDHMVRLWNADTGCCLALASGHMGAVGALAFSRKKKTFLVSGSSDRTIKVWSLDGLAEAEGIKKLTSQSVVAAHDKDINSLAVAPNDTLVCSGSQDRTARVWRLPELAPVLTLRGHKRGIWCVEFSPVDQCVLTASGDKTIRIWALSDGSCLKVFEGHTASVLRASFVTRGTQIVSAGADGLVKLWTIKSDECVNTFDSHEDKIWALAVDSKTEMLATGGGDSVVKIWEDCTLADEEEAIRKEEEEALKDQDLSNALADTDYVRAIEIAFELKRPFKLLNVFTDLLRRDGHETQIQTVLKGLSSDHVRLLLDYIREWNTKPKLCHTAQKVLLHLFHNCPPEKFLKVPGICELLEGIIPYTQRHYSRVDRLVRNTFLVDYTLASMSVLNPSIIGEPAVDKLLSNIDIKGVESNLNDIEVANEAIIPRPNKKGSKKKSPSEDKSSSVCSTPVPDNDVALDDPIDTITKKKKKRKHVQSTQASPGLLESTNEDADRNTPVKDVSPPINRTPRISTKTKSKSKKQKFNALPVALQLET